MAFVQIEYATVLFQMASQVLIDDDHELLFRTILKSSKLNVSLNWFCRFSRSCSFFCQVIESLFLVVTCNSSELVSGFAQ